MYHLYYGDNLSVLRESITDESIDLIYLDPPFNSNASYNVLFKGPSGNESAARSRRSMTPLRIKSSQNLCRRCLQWQWFEPCDDLHSQLKHEWLFCTCSVV